MDFLRVTKTAALSFSIAALAFGVTACGDTDPGTPDSSTVPDASVEADAKPLDATQEPDVDVPDVAPDVTPQTKYNDITNGKLWETFDTTTLSAAARGFTGLAFDGRYVYFVPYDPNTRSGLVARYDQTLPFASGASWATFDLGTLDPLAKGFIGSAFDGKYVYFTPFQDGTGYGSRIARLDTTANFSSAQAWTIFDATSVSPDCKGFAGSVFDGRYIYFMPYFNSAYDGLVTRYDTKASFTAPASWTTHDLLAQNSNALGFVSGTFDGRYLYLAPSFAPTATFVRFDTTASFSDDKSWAFYDIKTLDPNARQFTGAVFDGRYVYYPPSNSVAGVVARFDSTKSFTDNGSWSTFDLATVDPAAKSYIGAVFDGRYVTLIPSGRGLPHGNVARYDTQAAFAVKASWQTFDLTTVNIKAVGFYGGGFDGRHIYMANFFDGVGGNGMVLRFDAKSPPSIPPTYLPKLGTGIATLF